MSKKNLSKDEIQSVFESIYLQFVKPELNSLTDEDTASDKSINSILDDFVTIAKSVSHHKTSQPEKIFKLANTELYPQKIAELAESFGMMIVKIEARELMLTQYVSELENLKSELEYKNKLLTSKIMQMAQQKQQLKNRVKTIQNTDKNSPDLFYKNVRNTVNNVIEILDKSPDWEEFESYFIDVNEDFYKRLHQKHPNLTQREIRICAFLKLKMNTKEIANLTNLSVKTIEVYRNRLRKKLNLPISENLTTYISRI